MMRLKSLVEFLQKDTVRVKKLLVALLFCFILVAQLFKFEELPGIFFGFQILPGGVEQSFFLAALVVIIEFLALIWLLDYDAKSKLLFKISRLMTFLVPVLWIFINFWTMLDPSASRQNAGLFGATIPTRNGWWLSIVMVLVLVWLSMIVRESNKKK